MRKYLPGIEERMVMWVTIGVIAALYIIRNGSFS